MKPTDARYGWANGRRTLSISFGTKSGWIPVEQKIPGVVFVANTEDWLRPSIEPQLAENVQLAFDGFTDDPVVVDLYEQFLNDLNSGEFANRVGINLLAD